VPKAPVYKDDLSSAGKNEIRLARKMGRVKAIPKAQPV
jgi:hypothetical protein